jgi:hypothetical protein
MLWALKQTKREHCAAQLNADNTMGRAALLPLPQLSPPPKLAVAQTARSNNAPDLYSGDTG